MPKFEFMQICPTPARGKFTDSLYTDQGWWAEEKFDGDRRIAQFCRTADQSVKGEIIVRFTGRRTSEVDGKFVEKTENVPHLNGDKHSVPESLYGTVLDGEIVCPWEGAKSKDVTSIMGSKPAVAIQKQEIRGWLNYIVFDCLFYKEEDIRQKTLEERREYAIKAVNEWNNPHVRIAVRVDDGREAFLQEIWDKPNGEGIILKEKKSTYTQEKRWVKVKKEDTEDVVIMGYDEPEQFTEKTESYVDKDGVKRKKVLEVSESRLYKNGWIGAVRFGQYKNGVLTYCGSCSGMDDALRKELSENKEKYLGGVVEILANGREPETGKFRHPRWIQLRDNKNPQDCKWPAE